MRKRDWGIARPVASCLTAAVLAAAMSAPAAFADGVSDDGETYTVTLTYMESEGRESVVTEPTMTAEGGDWELVSVSEPRVDASYKHPTKKATAEETKRLSPSELDHVSSCFDAVKEYDEDGYEGTLGQVGHEAVPVYVSRTRQVDRTQDVAGLPSNDVSQIAQTKSFTVTSDSAYGASTVAQLALSDVSWEVTERDEFGIPTAYTAHLNYRGQESYLEIEAYDVTMNYEGTVTEVDGRMAVTATYEKTESPWWVAAAVGTAAAAAAAAIIAIVVKLRRRAKVIEADRGVEREICKLRISKSGPELSVDIPDDVVLELTPERRYWLEMPKRYCGAGYMLKVTQTNCDGSRVTMYDSESHRKVSLANPLMDY